MPGMGRSSILGCRFVSHSLLAIGVLLIAPSTSSARQAAEAPKPAVIKQPAGGTPGATETPCTAAGGEKPLSDRQVRLCQQTRQLHQLAVQLQSAVDRSSKDTLSVDVLRLSDQIQALAHQIQVELKQP
jgi:hypothetical protein